MKLKAESVPWVFDDVPLLLTEIRGSRRGPGSVTVGLSDDLVAKAQCETQQWEQIAANVGGALEFDAEGGPTVDLSIRYTTDGRH